MKYAAKKRSRTSVIISLLLVAALAVAAGGIVRRLPVRPQEEILTPPVSEFRGVINVWLAESFSPGKGSYLRWLMNSATKFEKKNKGLYINIKVVEPAVAERLIKERRELPDAIICSGGILGGEDVSLLREISAAQTILPAFTSALSRDGHIYGVPVSAGAYTILYNQERLARAGTEGVVTGDMLDALFAPAASKPKRAASYSLSAAKAEGIAYSLALANMMSIPESQAPFISPELFRAEAKKAWADFVLDRKSAAYVCTQKEVYRIRQLEAGEKAFPWSVHQAPCTYTDQLLSLHIFANETPSSYYIENALCSFAQLLIGEERQRALADIGAFSVLTWTEYLYPEQSAMHFMEEGLKSAELYVPNSFEMDALFEAVALAESAPDAAARLKEISLLLEKTKEIR